MTRNEYERIRRTPRPKQPDQHYGALACAILNLAVTEQLLLAKTPSPKTTALIAETRGAINALAPHIPDYVNRPRPQ